MSASATAMDAGPPPPPPPPSVYDGALMRPVVYFWRTCGAFSVDLSRNRFQTWFSAAVFVTGALSVAAAPWTVRAVDGERDDGAVSAAYRRLYTRAMVCAAVASRAAVVYKARGRLSSYKRLVDAYERDWPLSGSQRRAFRAYAASVVAACLLLTAPFLVTRFYGGGSDGDGGLGRFVLIAFYLNVYVQNWSMCCMETHFALLCFAAYLKFQRINDELEDVRADVMVCYRYPAALRSTRSVATAAVVSVLRDPGGRPLETLIEALRVRHGLVRESVDQLNDMFGGQLALSLIALYAMTMFDVYNEAFADSAVSRSKFAYSWFLQYVFRFLVIIITAHNATQEGYKTKLLITEINNRHLNNKTKYELQLFLKQINHQSIDITACDCFTLNSRLIGSVIAVGTTYIFVLIQFYTEFTMDNNV